MSENSSRTILVIGTFDTKNDELFYLSDCIQKQNGNVLTMDVSVLGDPEKECDISKHEVAKSANSTIDEVIKSGDENSAMQIMAKGSSSLAKDLFYKNKFIMFIIESFIFSVGLVTVSDLRSIIFNHLNFLIFL